MTPDPAAAREPVTADEILRAFAAAADAARRAVVAIPTAARRQRTDRPGQYALDLAADAAVLDVLRPLGVGFVSEESGRSGPPDSPVTIVIDPVDGSTNCSRGIPYWAISLCAVDEVGPWCALVRNQATGETTVAVRGMGATRDGVGCVPSPVEDLVDAVVALTGWPRRYGGWAQSRALGSAALALCDVAAGGLDGYLDSARSHAPWDYLGGLLACTEAGAPARDVAGEPLVVTDPAARRQLVAGGTRQLVDALARAVT